MQLSKYIHMCRSFYAGKCVSEHFSSRTILVNLFSLKFIDIQSSKFLLVLLDTT